MNRKVEPVQMMLYIILGFLAVFLGVGLYFLVCGIVDLSTGLIPTGLLGIGAFLIGAGFVGLMQSSMMRHEEDRFGATFAPNFRGFGYVGGYRVTGARMKSVTRLSYVNEEGETEQDVGNVACYVLDDAVLLSSKTGTSYALDKGDFSDVQQKGTRVFCQGKIHEIDSDARQEKRICLQSPTVMQAKAMAAAIVRML